MPACSEEYHVKECCMSNIRRLPGGNVELKSSCRRACGTKGLAWHMAGPSARLYCPDKQAPGCLLHAGARPRSQQANATCLKHCDGQLRPVRRSNLSATYHCITKAPVSHVTAREYFSLPSYDFSSLVEVTAALKALPTRFMILTRRIGFRVMYSLATGKLRSN